MTKPVLVVGAGPVGLTMAAELSRYGVPVRIIDKAACRTDKSKALAVWARTLELLERARCADAFVATGLKSSAVSIRSGEDRIGHVRLDEIASPFNFLLLIPQSESERVLEEHLQSLAGRIERGVELKTFEDTGGAVSCSLLHSDGQVEDVEVSWLIGCDGARSNVREHLGMAFEGDTLDTSFVLADVHVSGPDLSPTELVMFWHHAGIVGFFPISPGRYRIIADVGSSPRHDPSFEEIQAIVDERCPGGMTLSDPIWLSGFSVNERKVRDFRAGRVFLAGDAAHIHSPAGGQGMNIGMHDAFNLAWKLALVERGMARAELLDTYSVERGAVAEQILAESGRLTRMATVRNPLAQHLRNFAAHRLLGFSGIAHALADKLSEITVGYPNSPLNVGSSSGLAAPGPGRRLISGRPFGSGNVPRFALLAKDDGAGADVLERYGAILEPELRAPLDEKGIWLVRPDGYVAAVAPAGAWQAIAACLSIVAEPREVDSSAC